MLTRVDADVLTSRVGALAFDEFGDIGVVQLRPQRNGGSTAALRQFTLEDRDPEVGDLVCLASYANLSFETHGPDRFQVARQPVLRVGKVTQVFPNGQRLCCGPCFETSIPVFSGMSGSPVCYYDSVGAMRAVGLVCSDPDTDSQAKNDRSVAGRSSVARLTVRRLSSTASGKQEVLMSFARHQWQARLLRCGAGRIVDDRRPPRWVSVRSNTAVVATDTAACVLREHKGAYLRVSQPTAY
jgi:hypothetical protein